MPWQVINLFILTIFNSLFISELNQKAVIYSPTQTENSYIEQYTYQSFFETNLPDQEIDVNDIDEELLNATLFFYINKKRAKGRRKALIPSESLFMACSNILEKYSGNTINKLGTYSSNKRRNKKKNSKLQKILKKHSKGNGFKGSFVSAELMYLPVMKISKGEKYFFDDELEEGENNFFFGKKNKRKKDPTPIASHSYLSLVKQIIKQKPRQIKAKQFSELGCQIQIVQKSKKKIPYVKVIWMLGGYRLSLVKTTPLKN